MPPATSLKSPEISVTRGPVWSGGLGGPRGVVEAGARHVRLAARSIVRLERVRLPQVRADSHDNRPGGIPFPCHETRPALLGSPTGGEQALPFRDEPARSPQSPPESVVPEARAPELRGSAGTASGGHIQEPRQERNRDGDQSEPWGHPLGGGDSRREGLSLARRRRLLLRLDDLLRAP